MIISCRDRSFNQQPNSASIKVITSTGQTAINGNSLVQLTECNITYITVNSNYSTLLLHVHNGYADSSRTIKTVRQIMVLYIYDLLHNLSKIVFRDVFCS